LNIYKQKRQWKTVLFLVAVLIVGVSLWYTNILVHKIAQDERNKIRTWADAIHHRVNLVNSTNNFFQQLRDEERKRVELLVEATKKMATSDNNEDLTFYSQIISNNKTIPVIITDEKGNINGALNVDFNPKVVKSLTPALRKEFSVYPPVELNYYAGNVIYYYYKDSRLFTELKVMLDDLISSFFSEVVNNSASVPVIITDSTRSKLISFGGHQDTLLLHDTKYLQQTIAEMASENEPIIITVADQGKRYIFYKDSFLLTQLRYFPIIQFAIIGLFLLVAYLLFSTARRAEQNQVWVGLAKETAHQLGTPLSSMMAWVDYLETKGIDADTISELQKDVGRLETITERFSKIGSATVLKEENIVDLIYKAIGYLKTRTSPKVDFEITPSINTHIIVPLNYQLFDWVIENLVKNAVDAMTGKGRLTINIASDEKYVYLDVSDTGKGLPKNMFKTIFNPGYTSKQRGWGLGLSLSQRIIRDYHAGKIFVKSSVIGKGTTFRIVLKK
jgi:two-component system, sporulation sensor kinase D